MSADYQLTIFNTMKNRLAKSVGLSGGVHLGVFFSAKTHKSDCPFRSIVTGRGIWQGVVAGFLQRHLSGLTVNDPFKVRTSGEVLTFIRVRDGSGLGAFSLDVEDLYYSIPHGDLFRATRECIEQYGEVQFRNASVVSVKHFFELISFYLSSTFVNFEGSLYVQRGGICIRSRVAPVLSDIFLAYVDRDFAYIMSTLVIVSIKRFADDYLAFAPGSLSAMESYAERVK